MTLASTLQGADCNVEEIPTAAGEVEYPHGYQPGDFAWDVLNELPEGINDFDGLADYWGHRLLYSPLPKKVSKKLEKVFFEDLDYDSLSSLRDRDPSLYEQRVKQMVKLICMSPEFQKR